MRQNLLTIIFIVSLLSMVIPSCGVLTTAHVGNFSVAFNLSNYYYYYISQVESKVLSINTINEEFSDIANIYIIDRGRSWNWEPSNSTYIGYVEVIENPYWHARIYLDNDNKIRTYYYVLNEGLTISSHRSLTDSIDFFRDLKIEWVGL
jgi:hypothetical protein